jgi:excisionase family DNA binding protein
MTKFADLPEKTLLRPDEVAKFMSVHVVTVYRWADEGKVDSIKVGKVLRIYRESVVGLAKRGHGQ